MKPAYKLIFIVASLGLVVFAFVFGYPKVLTLTENSTPQSAALENSDDFSDLSDLSALSESASPVGDKAELAGSEDSYAKTADSAKTNTSKNENLSYEEDKILVTTVDGKNELRPIKSGQNLETALIEANNDPQIESAQPNFIYKTMDDLNETLESEASTEPAGSKADTAVSKEIKTLFTPNDSSYSKQWWIKNVTGDAAWDYARSNKTVSVGVIDTGVRLTHTDLKANINKTYAYNATTNKKLSKSNGKNGDGDKNDGHGTMVSGVVAAEANNAKGVCGISFNANIIPVCVFSTIYGEPYATSASLNRGYKYLVDLKAKGKVKDLRVINMSLGSYAKYAGYYDKILQNQIIRAEKYGIVTVAAAGNSNKSETLYPSDFEEVVSVTAIDSSNTRAYFSDHNRNKNIAAPGVGVATTGVKSDSTYVLFSGTSASAPIVSGSFALMFAYNPSLTVAQAKNAVYNSAFDLGDVGFDPYYGYGKLDINAAIDSTPKYYGNLNSAIRKAKLDRDTTKTSKGGKTIFSHEKWVSSSAKNILNIAIKNAELKASDTSISRIQIFNETNIMLKALRTFDAKKHYGKKQAFKNGTYRITSLLSSSKALNIKGASKKVGAKLQLWNKEKSSSQKFKIKFNRKNGTYQIKNLNSKKVLSAVSTPKSGVQINQAKASKSTFQRWWIIPISAKKYKIVSVKNPNVCFDLQGSKATKGTKIKLNNMKSSKSQFFRMKKIASN